MDYKDEKWVRKRNHILKRDKYIDQYLLRSGQKVEAKLVHHILPADDYPEYRYCDWNLISVSEHTHKKILHERYSGKLTNAGKLLAQETAAFNGVKLSTVIMVIGLPGTGKSTWAKKNLFGGVVYDMDAIAAAFRLTTADKMVTEPHTGARRMAAALRRGFIQMAPQYATRVIVTRTAPDAAELAETNPDRLVICTKIQAARPYQYDIDEYSALIDDAIKWAEATGIPVEYDPPRV